MTNEVSRDEEERENCNTVHFVEFQDSFQVELRDAIESRFWCRYVDSLSLDVNSNISYHLQRVM